MKIEIQKGIYEVQFGENQPSVHVAVDNNIVTLPDGSTMSPDDIYRFIKKMDEMPQPTITADEPTEVIAPESDPVVSESPVEPTEDSPVESVQSDSSENNTESEDKQDHN